MLYEKLRPCISILQDFITYEFNNNGFAFGGADDYATYHLVEMISTLEAIMNMKTFSEPDIRVTNNFMDHPGAKVIIEGVVQLF